MGEGLVSLAAFYWKISVVWFQAIELIKGIYYDFEAFGSRRI